MPDWILDHPAPQVALTLILFAPLFGACVGSFLNVVVYRLPRENSSVVYPGSHCFACGTMIAWYENIPVLSWLALGGKCGHCRTRIAPIYVATELMMAGAFGFIAWAYLTRRFAFARFDAGATEPWMQGAVLVIYAVVISALVAASWIDLRHRIIPDQISLGGTALMPICAWLVPAMLPPEATLTALGRHPLTDPRVAALVTSLLGALVGAGTIGMVRIGGKLMFGKEAMGMGDVKLMGLLGGLLGWQGVLFTLFLACLVGAVIGGAALTFALIATWWRGGDEAPDHYMPFGPYLALAAVGILLFRPELFALLAWVTKPRML